MVFKVGENEEKQLLSVVKKTALGFGDGYKRRVELAKYVAYAQYMLSALGYRLPKYGVDGKLGSETTSAIKKFQSDIGLPVTGRIDYNTAMELIRIYRLKGRPKAQDRVVFMGTPIQIPGEGEEITPFITTQTKGIDWNKILIYGLLGFALYMAFTQFQSITPQERKG